jgi:glycosyltransferase involved in cell wall biosynthesis
MRGGISAYAAQSVETLREGGDTVAVASPEPSGAEHVLDMSTRGAGRALSGLARASDRLVVQFYPDMLGGPGSSLLSRFRSLLRIARGLRAAPHSELCVHEMNYGLGPTAPIQRRLVRPIWQLADVITVHTERERREFAEGFGISEARIRVVSQGEHLVKRIDEDRASARAALGVPADGVVLVAIGFLQPNKGFDRAIRAFAALPGGAASLFVVGSVWREDEWSRGHVADLRRLAEATPGAELREEYLSDDAFDRWIVASDALVLPYRLGWSSNVMERGLLYDRPVIMSRVGGMEEQGTDRPQVTLVDDDAALIEALRSATSTRGLA